MSQTFIVHLRGATYQNPDGSSRQELISKCQSGDELTLKAEPENPHDRHAVAVFDADGKQLGYLPSDARDASSLLRGEGTTAKVLKCIGGPRWWHRLFGIKRTFGLLIQLSKPPIDWQAHNQHRSIADPVDSLVSQALALEKSGAAIAEVISSYENALSAVVGLNKCNPTAAAHRYQQAPINRLTMLLAKNKMPAQALMAYEMWASVADPVGLTKADSEALAKRVEKLKSAGAT